jgi:uncharacterized membrane protein YfcA
MPTESPIAPLVVGLVALLIGLSKGGMGAVLVVATTPLLSQIMTVPHAISLALPLLIIADGFALALYWKRWESRFIRQMLPAGVVGVAVGTVLLWALPELTLRRVLGLFTLAFIVYWVARERLQKIEYRPRPWHAWAAGGASGLGSALANTGAPPFTAYMLLQQVQPVVFAATTTLFFAIINLLKIPGLLAAGLFDPADIARWAWAIALIPVGVWLGRWLIARIDQRVFERALLVLLAMAAGLLLFT